MQENSTQEPDKVSEKMMPFTRGKKFWIEIQAFEDGSIEDCKSLGKLVFVDQKIDSFDVTSLVLNESYFTKSALEELKAIIDQKLNG